MNIWRGIAAITAAVFLAGCGSTATDEQNSGTQFDQPLTAVPYHQSKPQGELADTYGEVMWKSTAEYRVHYGRGYYRTETAYYLHVLHEGMDSPQRVQVIQGEFNNCFPEMYYYRSGKNHNVLCDVEPIMGSDAYAELHGEDLPDDDAIENESSDAPTEDTEADAPVEG